MATLRLRPAGGGEPIEIALERADRGPGLSHVARIGETRVEAEIELLDGGQGWIRLRDRIHPFFSRREADRLQVWIDGKVHELTVVDATPQRATGAAGAAHSGNLTAPMPGAVLKILTAPGGSFEAHQPLVIMESMKMELTLSVPHPGRVRKVACEVGELVELGAALIELEDVDDDTP